MTESGRYIERISYQFAVLKTELHQNGKLKLLNSHKHCENLVMKLINLVDGIDLKNLNKKGHAFKGLDLGSDSLGTGFEVTAENSSQKINEKLQLIIDRKVYLRFPTIRFFMLVQKQKSYSITVETDPFFSFDYRSHVIDFDDLLLKIGELELKQLQQVYALLADELPLLVHQTKSGSTTENKSGVKSFFSNLFKPSGQTDDDAEYDMSHNLWSSISPLGSNYQQKTKMVNSMPAGTQFFSFEYGPSGHAFPLNLKGTHARTEIQFTCKINNPKKAMFAGNEYALNYLPPKFLVEARTILEQYTPNRLRLKREVAASDVQKRLAKLFDDAGVTLESVTIGAIDALATNAGSKEKKMENKQQDPLKSNPKILFYNYRLDPDSTHNIIVGMPKATSKNEKYLGVLPLSVSNESSIDAENITVLFKYPSQSPLPVSDEGVAVTDKSYILQVKRIFFKDEAQQCSSYKIPSVSQESLVVLSEPFYMAPTYRIADVPFTTKDGVDVVGRIRIESEFNFEVLAMFRNCLSQRFDINLQIWESESFDDLYNQVTTNFGQSSDERTEHIVYYPDFKRQYTSENHTLDMAHFNKLNFRIISKVGNKVKVIKMNQNDTASEF
ncbi:MAG: SMEK domain-containing protein [Bacteroidota bacterium]